MDYQKVADTIESFIRDRTTGFRGVVLGLSGGLDSTVVAYLAVNALGPEKIYGLILPYYTTKDATGETQDAIEIAEGLHIGYDVINIKPLVRGFELNTDRFKQKLARENLMARIRMIQLYGFANAENRLVLGTSNKSEIMTGYFTKYGDGGADLEPIGDLYKTEVFQLAKQIGVRKKIIDKKPSAGLSPGQTDEDELGLDYSTLDKILRGQTQGIDPALIRRVEDLVKYSQHKRELPPMPSIER